MLRRLSMIGLLCVAQLAVADTLDIALSNTTAQFKYGVPGGLAGKSELYGELMYNDGGDILGGLGLLVANDETHAPGLTLGVGAKVVAATVKNTPIRTNHSALALGLQVRYELPSERRVALAGEYYYAPQIISYADSKHFQQFAARLEFAVSPQVQIYGGYRKVWFTVKNTDEDAVLINGPHLGVQMSF